MSKKFLFSLGSGLVFTVALTSASFAQQTSTKTTTTTTVTKTTQNPDGTYSVIEYPVGKEVTVDLTPDMNMSSAKGIAHITRTGDQTAVNLDLSGLPADATNYYVYAVDPSGAVTLLGPAAISNGASQVSFNTPMDKFMLVLSPTEGLSTIGSDTAVTFRSSVPKGYTVFRTKTAGKDVKATTAPVTSAYEVPMLGVPNFKEGAATKTAIRFTGDLAGVKGEAYIKPRKDGTSKIVMGFGNMKLGPKDKRFVLWTVSPDNKYIKLGQVVNTGTFDHAEIRGETALKDFGLFVTVEDIDVNQPTGTIYSPLRIGQ